VDVEAEADANADIGTDTDTVADKYKYTRAMQIVRIFFVLYAGSIVRRKII